MSRWLLLALALMSGPALACTSKGGLPDMACTPGAIDPAVSQENIDETICRRGYSAGVRPSLEVSAEWKRRVLRDYRMPGKPSRYEGDHLIPIGIGGCPGPGRGCDFHANYFPHPWSGKHSARDKDRIEWALYRLVCSGKLPLAEAQRRIAADWRSALDGLDLP